MGVSWRYTWYRLGFLVSNIVLSATLRRDVETLLPPFVSGALVCYVRFDHGCYDANREPRAKD